MEEIGETIDAELRPSTLTLSSGEVFLLVILVALFLVLVGSATSGLSVHHLLGLGVFLAGVGGFIGIYRSAHKPVSTEAQVEEGWLVVRDPNPWWKRLTDPYFGWKLRLVVQAVEWREDGPVVTGTPIEGISRGRKFRVWLKPDERQAPVLRTRLAEMARRESKP